jgi:hypothetical protein
MFVVVLKCNSCGAAGADLHEESGRPWREDVEKSLQLRGWLITSGPNCYPAHFCPTCRRAAEATDLKTALIQMPVPAGERG